MSVLEAFLDNVIVEIVNPIILLLAAAAFVLLIWGIVKFIYHSGDSTKRSEGRSAIMWGFVGMVVIFGVYGILNVATNTFQLGEYNDSGEFEPRNSN